MKVKLRKNDIQNVLARIQGLTGRKSNLAVTSSVLMETEGSRIKMTATDLETGWEGFYRGEIHAEGKTAINSKKLYEIVRDFPSDSILINEVENFWIEISDTDIEFHLVGMNPDDFPPFPHIENAFLFKVDGETLKRMIEQTIFIGSSSDEKRAHIIGTLFEIINNDEEKVIRMVSTDGNRLSTSECILDKDFNLPDSAVFIIPKKALTELNKLFTNEEELQIGFKDNHLIVKKENETIVIRLLEGEFPKYKEIFKNKDSGYVIKLDKHKFTMMLKRMSILSTDDYKGVIFKFGDDNLQIKSTNPEIGESKEEMRMEYQGDEIKAAFNPRYFMDALNSIEDVNIEINILNDEKPCFVEGETNKTFSSVIMPMRI